MAFGLKRVTARRGDALAAESWDRIEQLLAEYYRSEGYGVEHCGTGGRHARFDGGVDLRLRRGTESIVVQCKHWNAFKVPHNEVHQLLGIMVNEQATGAILVTSGEFTKAAIEAAGRHGHVQLVDGDDLRQMLGPLAIAGGIEARREEGGPGGWKVTAGTFGARTAERLVAAAEDRIRYGGKGRGRSVVAASAWAGIAAILLKLVLALALLWFGSIYLQRAMRNIAPAQVPAAQVRSAPRPSAAMAEVQRSAPRREAPAPVIHEPTPQEVEAWRRRNAESMEILRENTQELPVDPRNYWGLGQP